MLKSYQEIIQKAKASAGHKRIAVAGAEGKAVLKAIKSAQEADIVKPILIGNENKIKTIAEDIEFHLENTTICHIENDEEIAAKAIDLVQTGQADGMMKGKVATPIILKAILDKKEDLMQGSLLSHIALLQVPTYHKLFMVTDGGMVIQPTLDQKVGILQNGILMMQKLGVKQPKIAVLAAIEKVSSGMPETEHAVELVKMAQNGDLGDVVVEGPLAVDVVFSPEAAKIKGVESKLSGDPDILLAPSIACGNIFAKGLWHLAGAKIGGLVLGVKKPMILLSRSDDAETKLNSIALGVVTS